MTKYFKNIETLEDLRREYKKLIFMYHPDRSGGNIEAMKQINNEYDILTKELAKNSKNDLDYEIKVSEDMKIIIDALINIEDLNITILGTWIWIDGNTKKHKTLLKELGLYYSKNREKWYKGEHKGKGKHSKASWEELKIRHGETKVKGPGPAAEKKKNKPKLTLV